MVKRSRVFASSSNGGGGGGGGGASTVGAAVRSAAALYLTIVIVLSCGGSAVGRATAVRPSLADHRSGSAAAVAAERMAAVVAAGRYAEDAAARSGRSAADLSHITGTARKIKMYVKHRYLQVFPDGVVNSTSEDTSDYVILQRTSVAMGQLKIQGVATCMYLCMDACGLLYGSKDFEDECVFNEMMERHNYNTYTSAKYSNERRTLYLAFNKHGTPRKVQVKVNAPLGKLSACTRVLTQTVPQEEVEQRMAARHGHRHHHGCPPHTGPPLPSRPHRRSGGRKCPGKGASGGSSGGAEVRKKGRDETSVGDVGSSSVGGREDEECVGGGGGSWNKKNGRSCGGGDETGHRKTDAAGRKKKGKKLIAAGKGVADKPQRQPSGKVKKSPEIDFLPEPVIVIQAVTTVVTPSHDDGDDDDNGNDEDAAGTSFATAPTDEFLESNNN